MTEDLFRVYEGQGYIGLDGYPFAWHQTIKHLVREQAGHRCVRCGHPYAKGAGEWSSCDTRCQHAGPYRIFSRGEWRLGEFDVEGLVAPRLHAINGTPVEAQWRILTVHHLNGEKTDCRWWNLAALCQRCHLEIQAKVHMRRRWLREHSDWFKPYVAGFYASTLLGEELNREQVTARLEELLALEDRQMEIA